MSAARYYPDSPANTTGTCPVTTPIVISHICAIRAHRRLESGSGARGQSLVEFALIVPLLLILVVAIVDFGRVYTAMLTVESGAREAADYGAFHWYYWKDGATIADTKAKMEQRACVATMALPDFVGTPSTCSNPTVTISNPVPPKPGVSCSAKPTIADGPCTVTVELTYDFRLFAPLAVEFGGVRIGLPSTLTFSRDSTFAFSDFGLDAQP